MPESGPSPRSSFDDRQWAMICHLGALSGFLVPFGSVIVPAVIWSLKRRESELVDLHGKESLNFQLSIMLYFFIAAILIVVLIGIPLLFAIFVFQVVAVIKASVSADNGEFYEYPLTIRFIQ